MAAKEANIDFRALASLPVEEIERRIRSLPEKDREELNKEIMALTGHLKFIPNQGPQSQAYHSEADILLYGGEAGGGKSALIIGLALDKHKRSLIMRRQFADLGNITDELLRFHGSRNGFVQAPRPKLTVPETGQVIELGAAQNVGDEQSYQGQPRDLLGFDEAVHFEESQVRFLMGWLRTTEKGQRTRMVLASNPPVGNQGQWIIPMFAPWLDPTHPNPANSGELRWYITNEFGEDEEVDGPEEIERKGKIYRPLSRSFIRAGLDDNPFLRDTNYRATLDSLPEPMRSAMRDGNFMLARQDDMKQVFPSKWVQEAQARWTEGGWKEGPMDVLSVDPARGGADFMTLVGRHGNWFSEITEVPGRKVQEGSDVIVEIIKCRKDNADIVMDMDGGWGTSPYDILKSNGFDPISFMGSKPSKQKTADKLFKLLNVRAQAYWRFREALNPDQPGGSKIALPRNQKLYSDLTSILYEADHRGIKIESKDKIRQRIKRSTDSADAVIMAWFAGNKEKSFSTYAERAQSFTKKVLPTVNMGYGNRKKGRKK